YGGASTHAADEFSASPSPPRGARAVGSRGPGGAFHRVCGSLDPRAGGPDRTLAGSDRRLPDLFPVSVRGARPAFPLRSDLHAFGGGVGASRPVFVCDARTESVRWAGRVSAQREASHMQA